MSAAKLRRSALAPTASKWRSAGERDERVDPLFEIRFTDDVDLPMGDAVVERGKGELLVERGNGRASHDPVVHKEPKSG